MPTCLWPNAAVSLRPGSRSYWPLSEVSMRLLLCSEETGGISTTHNGIFKYDLTLDEFEIELKGLLEQDKPAGLKKRFMGGWKKWKKRKKILYIISSFLCPSALSMQPLAVIKTIQEFDGSHLKHMQYGFQCLPNCYQIWQRKLLYQRLYFWSFRCPDENSSRSI